LRELLDHVVGAKPDLDDLNGLTADLREWTAKLAETQVEEEDQVYFRRNDLPDRGQCFVPVFLTRSDTPAEISGTVTFGRYYLGGGGAIHGGAVSLLFDSAMGSFSNSHGRTPSRTAYLNVSFHALTPIDEPLELTIRVDREEGRKRYLVGELVRGDVVCARGEALFIALRADQV
jgi:acyl-coenzyme A thioesterase PaaI-like protein